jgi:hypothetical protein
MTLVVEEAYPSGVPQTAVPGWVPTGAGWHWTAGGTGRAGWDGTVRHLIASRYTVNASYHGGLWHEHAADGRCRTVIQWIVPTSRAAHSIAPSQVFQVNPNKDRATQDARFRVVRRILGARATDPNAGCIAIAYAGMPADLERDLACPVFRDDVQSLARQLVAHPAVIDRPHFGHGWIQPISRYEMDITTDFIGLLYGTPAPMPAPAKEEDMLPADMVGKAEEWTTTKPNAPIWTRGCGVGPQEFLVNVQAVDTIVEVGPEWRLVRLVPTRRYAFMRRADLTPAVPGGDPQYDAAVFRVIAEGPAALGGDCGDEIDQAAAHAVAATNKEWRDWLATAPAAAGDPTP